MQTRVSGAAYDFLIADIVTQAISMAAIRSGDYAQFPPQPPGSLVMRGTEWQKKSIGLYKEITFMNDDIKFLNIEWRIPYPLTKTVLDYVPQLLF